MTALELSDADLDRLFTDAGPRWVGVTPPSHKDLDRLERIAADAATRLADVIVDRDQDWTVPYRTQDYADARDRLRHARAVHDRMWADGGRTGMFAGWLVRDGEVEISAAR